MIAKRCTLAIACLSALGLAGCNNDHPDDAKVNFKTTASATAPVGDDTPDIPKDAQFTIYCRNFSGDNHVQEAREARQILLSSTSLKKWYIVHAADHSTLYYGFYRCNDSRDLKDPAEGKRCQDDRDMICAIKDSQGTRIFSEALPVNIDAPDPMANTAWDLTRSKGVWSIEIGSFANTPDRKERAVEAVREARAQGVEAYYYHNTSASSVCVGSWPAEAVVVIEAGAKGNNAGPDANIFVTANGVSPQTEQTLNKMGYQSLAPKVDIIDPTVTQMFARYPDHATNGASRTDPNVIDPVTKEPKVIEHSFLVKIPHPDPLDNVTDTAPPPIQVAKPAEQKGMGHLKSVDQ